MQAADFIKKWQAVELKERSASQAHFLDLCTLLGIEDPVTADPKGDWFTFERGASKTSGGEGWADVWRKGCFAWEYKGKKKDLDKAFDQLLQYSIALENPPLLIVSDMARFRVHTNWTNTVQQVHAFELQDLLDAKTRDLLRNCFLDPERLRPAKTRQALTEEAAQKFASLAQRLRDRKHDPATVAHFVNRLVFCMFAEDVDLLPNKMFQKMLELCQKEPTEFQPFAKDLFAAMQSGGRVGFEKVERFNGGLFDDDTALPLEKDDLADLLTAAKLDWSEIDPSILGTLFERGLDPDKRSQLGAHYTDRDKIMQIVNPVIVEPLLAEWAEIKAGIEEALSKAQSAKSRSAQTKAEKEAERLHAEFLERLRGFRVLDPACGSGNFLYLSLLALKDIEHRTNLEAEALGLQKQFPTIGPECVKGIELNPYAAELARVSVWVGEIQWMRRNGFDAARNPILRPLGTIENRDAVLAPDGTKANWPDADVVVGNPPFLGNKRMISALGEDYATNLRKAWKGVPGGVDLVAYWFAKAWEMMCEGRLTRAGLVSTNSIRSGVNREVLKPVVETGRIFDAWSDEEWTVEGAAVRVSMVCFDRMHGQPSRLDGMAVPKIFSDLAHARGGSDLASVSKLAENRAVAFQGTIKVGPFDLSRKDAQMLIELPSNANGRLNSEVVVPWANGIDVVRRPQDKWIIDFGAVMSQKDACFFEKPYEWVMEKVKPQRDQVRRQNHRENWWLHGEARPGMRKALDGLARFIATPETSKYRLFVWLPHTTLPGHKLYAIARSDDTAFGVLSSTFHELWSVSLGSKHGAGNDHRYTTSTTFETFPFPQGLTPNMSAADYANDPRAKKIAEAAAELNRLRENWLNPPDLVTRVPEMVEGYPDRLLPKDDKAEKELRKRTLTNLYNARPAWLDHAHKRLDEAVAEAYGWGDDWRAGKLTDDEILARLFHLNQERAVKQ
ncbi:class I SAM-dependent DNA methyltransferase [Ruegeria sp. PrR005]|uniref:site-specific DNA-methyltransferase (adenine-specific) n=2 Tax=Ruegeria sp. PrR005 TaxID=2706882 RepID=A0A6B2NTE4_9RHOB|nr:class I SAM-dependent DNA methyltransferase [Ruegeria sp. PrR005]NDW45694.1 class I SAM-dependent DNA methyltransferase [Ruegeria sp. PrR005]